MIGVVDQNEIQRYEINGCVVLVKDLDPEHETEMRRRRINRLLKRIQGEFLSLRNNALFRLCQ